MHNNTKKAFAIITAIIMLGGILIYFNLQKITVSETIYPKYDMPKEYIVFVDEPTEENLIYISALSSIVVKGEKYNPMFILTENGTLTEHQIWTLNHALYKDAPKFLFTSNAQTNATLTEQLSIFNISAEITTINLNEDDFNYFMRTRAGYDGEISVSSYEESLWASPLANIENKVITIGKATFKQQKEVWDKLKENGLSPNYVVVVNPNDYQILEPRKLKDYDNDVEYTASFHIKSLSAVASELSAFRKGYVITTTSLKPSNNSTEFAEITNPDFPNSNDIAIAILNALRELNRNYGKVKYIALVGSADAVPQWQLNDFTDAEPDRIISSDVAYGYLDDDMLTMDAAVGRIINYNVQGASNMIAKTLAYEKIVDIVQVTYSDGTTREIEWRKQGSSWNGYEVADQRMQNSPGMFFKEDGEDEGYTIDYMSTLGVGGNYQMNEAKAEANFTPILEGSGITAYRGHGSWHGTFYTWGYFVVRGGSAAGIGDDNYGHLEGEQARKIFMPPSTTMLASCENGKIEALHWGNEPIDMEKLFVTNYLYGGSIVLWAATEVSYSNIGQDIFVLTSPITGTNDWDKNNLVYAGFWDGILNGLDYENGANHKLKEGTVGEASMFGVNRYTDKWGVAPLIAPSDGAEIDYKQVSTYALYGDPMHKPSQEKEGANDYDPWH